MLSKYENEIWKSVKDYEGYYEVSNFGRVRSLDRAVNCKHGSIAIKKGKILKQAVQAKGYFCVNLAKTANQKVFKYKELLLWHL